ncbi:MAG: AAA family ATPase, partial [Microbacterium sp.]
MVGGASYRNDAVLVGREEETARLLAAMGQGIEASAATIVVHGEAGIGKTTLVARSIDALQASDPQTIVLRGVCLPLVSLSVPFIGIRSALRGSPRTTSDRLPPLPDLDTSPTRVAVLLDRWIDEVARTHRVVITIDDLQWADQDTLDALLYLAAGPAERPLTILGTIRDEDDTATRAIDQWVADLRRMPRVELIRLGLLDRAGTDAQVSALLNWLPDQSLVEEIFDKTRGHPYLTELTVSGVPPWATHLPPHLPDSVTSAVLGAVRALPPDTQAVL